MIKYTTQSEFKGYRRREDKTNLPAGFLVEGSQNVLSNVSERIGIRKGYTLDGEANTALTGIAGCYDWNNHLGYERNLRAYDDELEYRYVDSNDVVTYRRLMNGFTSTNFQFAEFWDTTELIDVLLFVNGTSNVYEWSGAVTTIASNTAVTLTKEGTTTWAEEGFYTAGTRAVTVNGVSYTYTGGENTTTLTGLTALPAFTVGDITHQTVRTTANSAITSMDATFKNDLIANLNNQIYLGSSSSRTVYVSKVNNYKDVSFTTPVRVVGEGAELTLDGYAVAFITQEDTIYISAGKDWWYYVEFKLSSDNAKEALTIIPLKNAPRQGAFSQNFVGKMKNKVLLLTNEVSFDLLGRVENILGTPDMVDISDTIRTEIDNTDFTGGSVKYHRNYIYLSAPLESKVLIYNLEKKYWEAPQVLPVGLFSIINGELYGQDPNLPQTYKLFDGTSDNGNPIDARAYFSYQNFGTRENLKSFNRLYIEGYIGLNTTLNVNLNYDYDGYRYQTTEEVKQGTIGFLCVTPNTASLGSRPLGSVPLGGRTTTEDPNQMYKFRYTKVKSKKDFFEIQIGFTSNEIDYQWEILAYGFAQTVSTSMPVNQTT
jgi:hypothetical protein